MGVNSEDSLDQQINMNSLILASFLAVASALPIEDTPEVAAAKAVFSAALAAAPAALSYGVTALNAAYPYSLGLPAGLHAAGLPYNGLPAAGHPYAGLPAVGLPFAGLPYAGLPY